MADIPHKPEEQLVQEVTDASQKIQVGAVYCHYKGVEKTYKVVQLATLESSNELCVVYQAQYGRKLSFIRPVSQWLEMVEWQGKQQPRFTPVV